MSKKEDKDLEDKLEDLKRRHNELDMDIQALEHKGLGNELQVKRLKKKKLQLKDEIVRIEDFLTPDIIA